jgi:hypothetical protein
MEAPCRVLDIPNSFWKWLSVVTDFQTSQFVHAPRDFVAHPAENLGAFHPAHPGPGSGVKGITRGPDSGVDVLLPAAGNLMKHFSI